MKRLDQLVKFISGSPQFRIREENVEGASTYICYNQIDLADDLRGSISMGNDRREVHTFDKVNTLLEGDMIFSLISGTATIVQKEHQGYLFTQNYIKLIPKTKIDKKFLVYFLNESEIIKKQFREKLQGSFVLKYTIGQIKELKIPDFPELTKQEVIGNIYFKQQKLEMLKQRTAEFETKLILAKIREGIKE